MKEFRFFFIVVFVMVFAMCFAYYSRLMPLLLAAVFFLCGLSLILSLIARLRFTVEVSNGVNEIRRKDSALLKIRIKNNFIVPLTPIRVYIRVLEKGKFAPQKKMLITALPPFKEVVLNIQNDVSFRGKYQIGFDKVEFFDILKIYRFVIKADKKASWNLVSFPRELPLDNRRLLDENEEEPDVTLTKPHGFNKDAFAYLREYRAGEPLRHIHWKLSARLLEGTLIVKQMEANHDHSSLIFLDFCQKYEHPEQSLEASDTVIETAIAITRGILLTSDSCNNGAVMFWQDSRAEMSEAKQEQSEGGALPALGVLDGVQLAEVTEARSYGDMVRALVTLPALPYDGEFTSLLDEFGDEIRLERAVYLITPAVTDALVNKLREMGLIYRSNVTLAVIPSDLIKAESDSNLLEYLKNETKITVFDYLLIDSGEAAA
jgi:uncharacterized protein (DUF58 family)